MIKLSGLLEYSMGGFLCLRGYASFKELSRASDPNPDYQRPLIEKHAGEMAEFLNAGEYRFFPEVILSLNLVTDKNYEEVQTFINSIQVGSKWNRSIGAYNISIYKHGVFTRNKIATVTFDESEIRLCRIDGNHRLSAANDVSQDFPVPFCILFFRTEEENNQYSRAIFYNINAKQIPLNLEENLKVILNNPEIFSDASLIGDPSFGWKVFLARKMITSVDFSYFPAINSYISSKQCSFFVELFGFLLDNKSIEENEHAVDVIKAQLVDVERALVESEIISTTSNIAVIGALAYYRLTNASKYRGFLTWVKRNNIGNVDNLRISDVIGLYDEIYEHVPKRAFLARWYPADTDPAYSKSVHRVNAIKKVAEELQLELTDLGTRDTGTFDIREVMYRDIRDCDIFIADLTGARHNVMVEVGYALKHISTGRMVFYFQETDEVKGVPFDVNHFSYDRIEDSAEIETKTKARIERILEQARNGEI